MTAALLVVVGVALLAPAVGQASVTIGSNLGRAPEGVMSSFGCSPPCTFSQDVLSADRQAPGGLVSPVDGTITLWRIRAAGASSPTALRVISPLATGLFTGAGTSSTVTPALNTTSVFPTQLPIKIGDAIGINCCQPPSQYFLLSGGTMHQWQPVLADGDPGRASAGSGDPHEIVLNADIEPTSGFSSITAKPKHGGKLKLTVNVPNPGTLAASAKKILKSTSIQVAAPGQAILLVKPTKSARSALSARGKLKAKVKVTYTPLGGGQTTQVVKAKLKP
jgi:hypothetical protein